MASRRQHYVFAHRLLPALFHQDPEGFLELLRTDGDTFLRFWWRRSAAWWRRLPTGTTPRHEIRHLDDDTVAVLVILPPPKALAEAYFLALVYRSPQKDRDRLASVFTLESGVRFPEGTPRTVLGGWYWKNGGATVGHVNFGDGPDPEPEAFLRSVQKLVATSAG